MVNLTRIYTRTGDGGSTRLGDMSETSKTDLRLRAYADVDETNAHLGLVLATGGGLGGFRWGTPVKRWLLDHEAEHAPVPA